MLSDIVAALQERSGRAFPAPTTEEVGGWTLRHHPGCSWWLGSVLPHGEVDEATLWNLVDTAEAFYARYDLPALFQVSAGAVPAALDSFLAARGYETKASVSLQKAVTKQVAAEAPRGDLEVRVDFEPTREWFEASHAVGGGDADAVWATLERIEQPSAYASVLLDGATVAVGRVVAEDGWAGVFGMATLPQARGRGAATAIIGALADWAGSIGADDMYLQVEHRNVGAWRIYERLGFAEIVPFHFRVQPR